MKILLILVDGMRPDAAVQVSKAQDFMKEAASCLNAATVMPSVTLPCHVSLFHSVDPMRHGTTTNTYAPQVRPIRGLCEVLAANGKTSAFFYNWEELRDLTRPGSLTYSYYCKGGSVEGFAETDDTLTDAAITYLRDNNVDFTFLYQGYVDNAGHEYGWMGEQYMYSVEKSWNNIERIVKELEGEYTVIVTADHGGHDRTHGSDLAEDMTIPLMIRGKDFEGGSEIENANIMDIAPTVAKLLGVGADPEWEGKSLL